MEEVVVLFMSDEGPVFFLCLADLQIVVFNDNTGAREANLNPVCNQVLQVGLLEGNRKSHLNVVSTILVELVHPDATV